MAITINSEPFTHLPLFTANQAFDPFSHSYRRFAASKVHCRPQGMLEGGESASRINWRVSELEAQGELHLAGRSRAYRGYRRYRGVHRIDDAAEPGGVRRVETEQRRTQLRVIEDVVKLRAELQPAAFRQRERLVCCEIDLPRSSFTR